MLNKILVIATLLLAWPCQAYFYIENGQKIELSPIMSNAQQRPLTTLNLYKKPNGQVVGIENRLFIELELTTDLDSLCSQYQLERLEKIGKNIWLFSSKQAVLPLLEQLYQNPKVINAYPDFLKKANKR